MQRLTLVQRQSLTSAWMVSTAMSFFHILWPLTINMKILESVHVFGDLVPSHVDSRQASI